MILNTKHFGQIQIQEDKILIFEEGIPGFPNNKKYVLICDEENEDSPFAGFNPLRMKILLCPFKPNKDL